MRIGSEGLSLGVAGAETQRQGKLADAAQQFEAMMLQEMLKPLRSGQDSWGGDEKNEDSASDTISSFGTEAVAKAISKGGGLGIARQVIQQVQLENQRVSEKKYRGTKVCGGFADKFK